jgi:proteasome accessory factor B
VASSLSTVNPEDRLFHLILALMATSQGLTKEQILTTVRGYREDTDAGMARESIERRFERDKDSLRELGIPLEALIPPEEDGNNKSTLYRIPKGDYDLPEDVVFSSRDVALLNLAAAVWREGSLSRDAKTAQIKLASLGALVDETLLGFAPILSTREPALATLREAIDKSVQVSFSYLKPGETTAITRTISPWALVNHEGRWHVMGHDSQSNQERTFLLRRIVSTVSPLGSTPAIPGPAGIADRALRELHDLYEKNTATLQVKPGTDAASSLRARAGTKSVGGSLVVHFTDADVFANELTSWGSDVVVLDPPELRHQVIANLEALVRAHG